MSNNDMFTQSYTDLIELLYSVTGEIGDLKYYEELQETLNLVNDITTQLKRMGETNILEVGDMVAKDEKKETIEDIIVEHNGNKLGKTQKKGGGVNNANIRKHKQGD